MAIAQDERVTNRTTGETTRYESTPYTRSANENRNENQMTEKIVGAAFATDAVVAGATVVLAILGLTGLYPAYMIPIAVITTAAALLLKSGGAAARLNRLIQRTGGSVGSRVELESGVSAEMVGGAAGIALGVLALLGFVPATLSAVAIMVFGGVLVLGGGETYRLSQYGAVVGYRNDPQNYVVRISAESSAAGESLVGISAIVLGILSLNGMLPMTLTLIGLLCVGGALLLSGAAIGAAHGSASLKGSATRWAAGSFGRHIALRPARPRPMWFGLRELYSIGGEGNGRRQCEYALGERRCGRIAERLGEQAARRADQSSARLGIDRQGSRVAADPEIG